VEVCFWKNVKECHEIVEGYGSYKAMTAKAKIQWTEEQELELRQLYKEHKDTEGMDSSVTNSGQVGFLLSNPGEFI